MEKVFEKVLSITDQINNKYRDYALYVLQSRGIPNFYDSLTPVQRIILENAPNSYQKTVGIVGEVIRTGLYHHGDSSLAGAISKLARPFGCSAQILDGDGFFGSPVNPNPSAPRYTSVRINSTIKDIVQQHADLNDKNEEGGHDWLHVEMPIGLLTHIIGIAVGYRTNILPRKLEDIIEYLEGKNKLLKPYFRDFEGKIYKFDQSDNVWLFESGFTVDPKKKTVRIFDLPPVMKYESFMKKLLVKLEINDYDAHLTDSSQSKCDITLSLRKLSDKDFKEAVALIKKQTQIAVKEDVVFIKDGIVAQFDSVKEYLDSFKVHLENVKLRRLMKDASNLSLDLEFLEAKLKFLHFMREKKRKNAEIIGFINGFKKWIGQKLSKIEIVKLSPEYIKETEAEIKAVKLELIRNAKLVVKQEKIVKKVTSALKKNKPASLIPKSVSEKPIIIDPEVEIFEIEEEDEEDEDSVLEENEI